MMYQNKLAIALKSAKGHVLREFDDRVYMPFGSEYSVFIKNMNTRRAMATIKIDGIDIGDGVSFIVPASGQLDIERFVRNGNLGEGNRFKFIERTSKVVEHRGVDISDGLVEVTLQLEREYKPARGICISVSPPYIHNDYTYRDTLGGPDDGDLIKSFTTNDVGVTAPGSLSEQQFVMGDNFPLETEKTVFVLQILGETRENQSIRQPVTVKTRAVCSQCGTRNPASAKFCKECGSSLQIV